jgi:putative transposase
VPTITFGVLYCFFIISHDRRRILHVNVTKHPTSGWIIQQLREAFPFESSHKYLIFDRDQKFGFEVIAAVKATEIIPKRTSFRSPWQNGIAERWVGSCRRDLLDHIVALNECHLKRLLAEYVRYHHEDRTHLGLEKATPDCRIRSVASGRALLMSDSAGCTIVTIEPPSSDRLSAILNICVCCTRKHRSCSPKYSRCVEARMVFGPFPSRTVSFWPG